MNDKLLYTMSHYLMEMDWENHLEEFSSLISSLASQNSSFLPLKLRNCFKMIPFFPRPKMNFTARGEMVNLLIALNVPPTHDIYSEWLRPAQA